MRRRKEEAGAILPLTLFLAIAFLAVVGMMIDVSLWSATQTEVEHSTDMAAMVALERFLETAPDHGSDIDTRLREAASRASAIAGFNFDSIAAKNQLMKSGAVLNDLAEDNSGNNGQVIPGIWHFEAPAPFGAPDGTCEYTFPVGSDTSQACPCGADLDGNGKSGQTDLGGTTSNAAWNGPCFEELLVPSISTPINAMKVSYTTGPSGKVSMSSLLKGFTTIIGGTAPEVELQAESYAAIKPRRSVFLLDLSPSMVEDTHIDDRCTSGNCSSKNRPQYWGAYANEIKDGEVCPDIADIDDFTDPAVCDPFCTGVLGELEVNLNHKHAMTFRCVPPNPTDVAFPAGDPCLDYSATGVHNTFPYYPDFSTDISLHRRTHYKCVDITTGDPHRPKQTFLVDEGNTSISRPEPLSSALDGINAALTALKERAVSADKAAVIGFDTQSLEMRATTDGITNPAMVDVQSTEIQSFIDATDTSLTTNKYSRFLFPRLNTTRDGTNTIGGSNTIGTDLFLAFDEAAKLIEADPLSPSAENLIVLFSDGISTCVDPAAGYSHPTECGTSLMHHLNGTQDLFSRASELLSERDVHIHVFLSGDASMPHTLLKQSMDGTTCMTDSEARANSKGFVWPTHILSKAAGGPAHARVFNVNPDMTLTITHQANYYKTALALDYASKTNNRPWPTANILYTLTRRSEGLWIPLRRACPSAGASFINHMEKACQLAPGGPGTTAWGQFYSTPLLRQPVKDGFGNNIYGRAVDFQGRLRCDPEGRTKAEQVTEAIAKLMDRNPYLLVKP